MAAIGEEKIHNSHRSDLNGMLKNKKRERSGEHQEGRKTLEEKLADRDWTEGPYIEDPGES